MNACVSPGFFSVHELSQAPNVVTALRFPLALAFPILAKSQLGALTVLAIAGATDLMDGWMARRSGQVTMTGAVLDPIADKTFVIAVAGTLFANGQIPRWGIPCLLAREILEGPLLLWILMWRPPTGAVHEVHASALGKAATATEFAAMAAALLGSRARTATLILSAITGVAAGIAYWQQELSAASCRR